ncbi:amidophosphoribosyltransferase [Anaerotruncus sp. 80]|uniref:Amidophosphoribosyltransferase n=1 Tax=Anaerotruncus colihominis TaxID=169435 RepID=A0A845QI12_9FIRM|nr:MULTISPECIES: amidophosphoribosyltransferase [Anaerotruncus]NBH60565.1 amidophosphoribosyltransferase [Anaerotruncus colihominis]NCF01219.1 amidophosphoribosyltransferase [Anaerotruncus sp. 80]
MGGFFGVAARQDCVFDLFFGIDYHSHLGTRRGGMAVYGKDGFNRAIHNIENSPFRTKFNKDMQTMDGIMGIGCISDYEPQPLIIRSHHGTYALTTVGKINNVDSLVQRLFDTGHAHFLEMSGGEINATELVAALINQKENLIEGMHYAQEVIDGSISLLLMNKAGIYAARDKYGRTPIAVGKKEEGFCFSFESFAYKNLGYTDYKELGPGEIAVITDQNCVTLLNPNEDMKICTFLWVYYGFPASSYEGISVERMRNACGAKMAQRDSVEADYVAGVPDSGIGSAVGYSNASGIPYGRPFIKYTPTWMRSFMPTIQTKRNLIAKMKLLTVEDLIKDKRLVLIDDSIVRGTQLRETAEYLFEIGAKELHIRPACPPIMYGCKYLNFSRSSSEMDLITRRVITRLENGNVTDEILEEYANPETEKYAQMVEEIRKEMGFTTLQFCRLDDMMDATGLERNKLCTYCWNGKE